jgi:hypothetical protein
MSGTAAAEWEVEKHNGMEWNGMEWNGMEWNRMESKGNRTE